MKLVVSNLGSADENHLEDNLICFNDDDETFIQVSNCTSSVEPLRRDTKISL